MDIHYCYAYLDPRKAGTFNTSLMNFEFEPFYIGKGKGRRIRHHLTSKSKSHKTNKIRKIKNEGFEPIILKIIEDVSESKALHYESTLIRELGTVSKIEGIKTGPLTNLKIDGAEQKYSEESRLQMSRSASDRKRKPHSEETKQKMREANARHSPEEKQIIAEKLSRAGKGRKASPEECKRLSNLHKGKTISEEQREKARIFNTGRIKSDKEKRTISERQRKTYQIEKEETREVILTSNLKQWCIDNDRKFVTIFKTIKTGKFSTGFRIIGKSGGTHFV